MINFTELVSTSSTMGKDMKELFMKGQSMDREYIFTSMEIGIMVNGEMIGKMEKDCTLMDVNCSFLLS